VLALRANHGLWSFSNDYNHEAHEEHEEKILKNFVSFVHFVVEIKIYRYLELLFNAIFND
jgi:hypothetical protein